jgi:hypothetical protein
VGPRTVLDDMETRKILPLPGLELRTLPSSPVASQNNFILIGVMRGGVQLSPICTTAANRLILLASGDYNDGENGGMIGRGNRSTQRNRAPMPLCPPQTPHDCRDANPGLRGGKPATIRLSYGTALASCYTD